MKVGILYVKGGALSVVLHLVSDYVNVSRHEMRHDTKCATTRNAPPHRATLPIFKCLQNGPQ